MCIDTAPEFFQLVSDAPNRSRFRSISALPSAQSPVDFSGRSFPSLAIENDYPSAGNNEDISTKTRGSRFLALLELLLGLL